MNRYEQDRLDGHELAMRLTRAIPPSRDIVVVALPTDGVAVAYDIAMGYDAPLDVVCCHEVRLDGSGFTFGAVAEDSEVLDLTLAETVGLADEAVREAVEYARARVRVESAAYRDEHPMANVYRRRVILVDCSGHSPWRMAAATASLRSREAADVIIAVAGASELEMKLLRRLADEVVSLRVEQPLRSCEPDGAGAISSYQARYLLRSHRAIRGG